jgi:FixJ family two-component response regulator
LPVIVLTAHGTVDALVDCLKAGASGFLVKPPAAKDLQHELGRAKRIAEHQLSPRLATDNEADSIRQILEDRDLV